MKIYDLIGQLQSHIDSCGNCEVDIELHGESASNICVIGCGGSVSIIGDSNDLGDSEVDSE